MLWMNTLLLYFLCSDITFFLMSGSKLIYQRFHVYDLGVFILLNMYIYVDIMFLIYHYEKNNQIGLGVLFYFVLF